MASVNELKTQVANTKVVTVWDYFEKKKKDIAKYLPSHITPDRLIGVMTFVIKSNPEIMKASQMSLIGAVLQTVQMGLEPGNIGHCYYVPYFNKKKGVSEVQFIIGYKGIIELISRAGKAAILNTEVVYENDYFKYMLGLNPTLEHVPAETNRGAVKGVYCVAKNLLANERVFLYIPKEDIDKVRNSSKAVDSPYSPWNTWYEEMAKKTAVKRASKLLPLSIEVQQQLSSDETTKTRLDNDMTAIPDETDWQNNAIEPPVDVPPKEEVKKIEEKTPEPANDPNEEFISQHDIKRLMATVNEKKPVGLTEELFMTHLQRLYGVDSRKNIKKIWLPDIIHWIKNFKG